VILIKIIPLTKGYEAMVDDEDYEMLNKHKWCAVKSRSGIYARRALPVLNGKQRCERMHRVILGLLEAGLPHADHINGNSLDNRKCNLRIVTNRQNCMNRHPKKKKTSKYPGVYWAERDQRWVSQAQINGKHISIGYFKSEESAREAYLERTHPIEQTLLSNVLQCPSQEKVIGVETE
jgi:hypothetical protein